MANVSATSSNLPAALGASTSAAPANKAEQQQSQFLELLVAQLKGQNPLDPKDGTEFVSQLAQFSSLEELINIRTTLDSMSKTSTSTATNAGNPFQGA
jgi:flagellar basal-body rod modification protein FlgD